MQITITARRGELPPMLEPMLQAKAEKLERFGHTLIALHAIFDREKYLYTAEVTLSGNGVHLVGKAKHPSDLLTCMEQALGRLERQLKGLEEKRIVEGRRRAPHRPG